MLYIVSTPIGNLEDITLRGIRTLKEVDQIVCEDTRHSKRLLQKYEINTPLLSYHSHSGHFKEEKILSILEAGKNVALISDAGTPGISDPGYKIIKKAVENGVTIVPIPGPSAFLTALQASALPLNRFLYLGFLPLKKGRQTLLKSLKAIPYSIVFYESCHRIIKTLSELPQYFEEEREVVVARELTKMHEEFYRSKIGNIEDLKTKIKNKGEFVVIISPL